MEWHLDTGAIVHMTDNPGNLKDLIPYHGTNSMMIGNGSSLPITPSSTGQFGNNSCRLSVHDVLVVLDSQRNLLLVS